MSRADEKARGYTPAILSGKQTDGTITPLLVDADGKLQIDNSNGWVEYKGVWNANTNTPTLTSGTGTKGNYYKVSVAGTTNLDGITDWKVGDWAIFNGATWDKVDNTESVSSVFGRTGAIVASTDDYTADQIGEGDLDIGANDYTGDALQFNGLATKTYSEGLIYYDTNTRTFTAYNDRSNFALNMGEEHVIRVVNKTVSQINDGQVIYVSGAQGNRPKISLAQGNAELTATDTIGVATENIAVDDEGMITTSGIVRGFDTSGFTAGDKLYLDSVVAGKIVNVMPSTDNYNVRIGWALNSTNNGMILVDIAIYQPASRVKNDSSFSGNTVKDSLDNIDNIYTNTKHPNGYIVAAPFTPSFNNGNRTLTLTGTYSFYYRGTLYSKTNDTIQISTDSGIHYIYYDSNGDLTDSTSTWDFSSTVPTMIVYWNSNDSVGYMIWEAHGQMPWQSHYEFHNVFGTQYISGLAISGYNLNTSTADSDLTFQSTDGIILDEDIPVSITNSASPSGLFEQELRTDLGGDIVAKLPIFYIETGGGGNQWVYDTPDANGIWWKYTGAGRVNYNNAAAGTQVQASSNTFVAFYVFGTSVTLNPMVIVQGQRQDASLADSIENNTLASLQTYGVPFSEFKLLYILHVKTLDAYTTTGKARLMQVDDYRGARQGGAASYVPIVHSGLSGLDYVSSGHTGFQRDAYETTSNPTANNDGIDSAGIGRVFTVSDIWVNTSADTSFICVDNTTTAAVWNQVGITPTTSTDNAIACYDGTTGKLQNKGVLIDDNDVLKLNSQINYKTQTLSDGANIDWNLNSGNFATVTLGGNRAIANPTNLVNGGIYILIVKQDGSGSRTLSWGANYYFASGTDPILSTGINDIDMFTFVSDGTYLYNTGSQYNMG